MFLKTLVVGPLGANCYLIGCPETGEGAVIDPGAEGERILAAAREAGLNIKQIINTHGHGDHIGANGAIKAATGAAILIHRADAHYLTDPGRNLSVLLGSREASPPADRLLEEDDTIAIGKTVTLRVIHTPGHTPGGICLHGEGLVFTGDTLFAGSIGRTDFPGGSYSQLISSIKEKLFTLDDALEVYPGHGPASTIGSERVDNPFFT
ncbi:Hydroxyacylglutathione hydrolase GloC [Moorella thermoacetica]|uniref:Hydroxyacylglutathione hydrolase GloC n=2 Tax=Neomoorella thermoacetica TaxID=1525 RepID=A0AAC9HIT5_NEOTH|nr:MBL fold metallo-hydrolase [Moorella thermoacetica]AOQ24410.1 putative metallo-hydrolase [Moorella thermoacetica]TYL11083.1 Hydroxyacylglutathione hydrolase GloC [Moorella thermoacetica]GAF24807.1 Zn-dependent hydrolases, including glyoxylases [Moorella thermoacetica Y72]